MAFKITNAEKGISREQQLSFKMAKKDRKAKNKITVYSKGRITIKRGLKKGRYSIRVKVTAPGNETYKAKTKMVTVTVKVS